MPPMAQIRAEVWISMPYVSFMWLGQKVAKEEKVISTPHQSDGQEPQLLVAKGAPDGYGFLTFPFGLGVGHGTLSTYDEPDHG